MLTVKMLKEMIKDWPEEDYNGLPTEVWIETGRGLSSPVTKVEKLNYRVQDGHIWCDLLLESDAFETKMYENLELQQ